MRKLMALLVALLLLVSVRAEAVVLDFEDLQWQSAVPLNYKGLTWDSNWMHYGFAQPPYNASSGTTRIYTHNFGGWIDFGEDVRFLGSWVASDNWGQSMYWEGYNDGVKLFESSHLTGGAAAFLSTDWLVDKVNFVSTSYNHFILDDITYEAAPDPVPEPSTILLLGIGLAGVGFYRRQRQHP